MEFDLNEHGLRSGRRFRAWISFLYVYKHRECDGLVLVFSVTERCQLAKDRDTKRASLLDLS